MNIFKFLIISIFFSTLLSCKNREGESSSEKAIYSRGADGTLTLLFALPDESKESYCFYQSTLKDGSKYDEYSKLPLPELINNAQGVHRQYISYNELKEKFDQASKWKKLTRTLQAFNMEDAKEVLKDPTTYVSGFYISLGGVALYFGTASVLAPVPELSHKAYGLAMIAAGGVFVERGASTFPVKLDNELNQNAPKYYLDWHQLDQNIKGNVLRQIVSTIKEMPRNQNASCPAPQYLLQ